jgi:hypothetical protein
VVVLLGMCCLIGLCLIRVLVLVLVRRSRLFMFLGSKGFLGFGFIG